MDQAIALDAAGLGITQVKIWNLDGLNIYDTDKAQMGQVFALSEEMLAASQGVISSTIFDERNRLQHLSSPFLGLPDFEVYLPVRDPATREIVAIAEFYQVSEPVLEAYYAQRRESWLLAGIVSLMLIAGLYHIVSRASHVIARQRRDLDAQVVKLNDLLAEKISLQDTAQLAAQRSMWDRERQLRRIGADLHDSVGQLISIALLKLSSLFEKNDRQSIAYIGVKKLLNEALSELRLTAADIALPEIKDQSIQEAVEHMVSRHRRRTETEVTLRQAGRAIEVPYPLKLCVCRFVQETLTNAYKYAAGKGQLVETSFADDSMTIIVSDAGPGLTDVHGDAERPKLGLIGLRNRIESLGGAMTISGREGGGTVITAILQVKADRNTADLWQRI